MSLLPAEDRRKWFEWTHNVTSASGSNTFLKFSGGEKKESEMNVDAQTLTGVVCRLRLELSQQLFQARQTSTSTSRKTEMPFLNIPHVHLNVLKAKVL